MDTETLKSLQAPLKDKYAADPASACITLSARGMVGENISCKLDTGRALVQAGLHPATGGDGLMACSGDLLLEALVACAGVTLNAVATSKAIDISGCTIIAEGDIDFRGTLGVSREAPVGFREIRLRFAFQQHITEEEAALLKKLTERYCVVYQTLVRGVPVITEFFHAGDVSH